MGDATEAELSETLPGQEEDASKPKGKGAGKESPPEWITRQEHEASLEQLRRDSQSLVDKADARITQRFQTALQRIELTVADAAAAGHEIPPATVQLMKDQAFQRALSAEGAGGKGGGQQAQATQQAQAGQPDPSDPMVAAAYEALQMMEEAGVRVEQSDPEFKLIDVKTRSTHKFLSSVERAIEAKKKRQAGSDSSEDDEDLDEEEHSEEGEPDDRRQTRVPGSGAGKRVSLPDGQDPLTLLKQGYKEHQRRR